MSSLRRARVVAALVPAVLLLAAPAHAEKVVTDDAVGDVQQADLFADDLEFLPAPDEGSTDIVRTVAAYGTTRVAVTVHFRDLLNTRYQETYVELRTPRDAFYVVASKEPGSRVRTLMAHRRGADAYCRGLRVRFDGGADTVSLSIPAACLDDPRWVQLGVAAVGFALFPQEATTAPFYGDDGHRGTIRDTSLGKGPRIHRG